MIESNSVNSFGFFRNLGRVRSALEGIKLQIENKPLRKQESNPLIVITPSQKETITPQIQSIERETQVIPKETQDKFCQTEDKQDELQNSQISSKSSSTTAGAVSQQPLSVLERLEIRFLKETITQYNADTQVIYGNFTDSLKVIDVLKKKIESQNQIIASTYDSLKADHQKLIFSHTQLKKQSLNNERLSEFWKQKFQILKDSVFSSIKEQSNQPLDDEKMISQLTAENKELRSLLSIAYSEKMVNRFEMKIDETESDFYNNHCQKNPPPSDLEIKYMTSNNKGFNKEFKKFTSVEKSFESDDLKKDPPVKKLTRTGGNHPVESNEESNNFAQQKERASNVNVQVQPSSSASGSQPKQSAMSVKDLKSFNESSSKLEALMKRIEGNQQQKVKNAQMNLLDRENSEDSSSSLLDSEEVEVQVNEQDDEEDNEEIHEEPFLNNDSTKRYKGEGDSENLNRILMKETESSSPSTIVMNSKNEIPKQTSEENEIEGEEEDQEEGLEDDEEEEDGEYYEEQQDDHYLYANSTAAYSRSQQQQQIEQKNPQKEDNALSDRARAKELFLLQSKQFSQQMTNQKFFKTGGVTQ